MSSPQPFIDRRNSVRNAIAVPVVYGIPESWADGTLVDISAGGVGLTGTKTFPLKTELELRFGSRPGKGHLISVRAVVRHLQGPRMGLEFVNLGAGDHRKILETIQSLTAGAVQAQAK